MNVTTYGDHAENAASALNALIQVDDIPVDAEAVDQLLHCREAIGNALRQRLYDVGQQSSFPPDDHLPAKRPKLKLGDLDQHLATLVDNIAFALPCLPLDENRPHAEALSPVSSDKAVELWRSAAIEMLSASHALSAAAEQPWTTEPGAGWWVMRDIATSLEALVVLDARLDEVGLLNSHHRPSFFMGIDEKRMVLSQAARVATWHATTASPDEATPRPIRTASATLVRPVALVSEPGDIARAQGRLARFIKPMHAHDAFYDGSPEITADAARQITASQLFLCDAFARAADRNTGTSSFSEFFGNRAEVLAALQPRIAHLVDVRDHPEPNMRRFWQQAELTTAVTRMLDQDGDLRLGPTQMLELARTTHAATHNLGKALRRELLRTNTNLVDDNPRYEDGPRRVVRRSPLEVAVTDLVSMPAPSHPAAAVSHPLQRLALQQRLTLTPTSASSRPPLPFPMAHGAGSGGPSW